MACLGHHTWATEWKARGCWRPEAGPEVLWVTHHLPPADHLRYPGARQGVAPSGGPAGVRGPLAQGLVVPDRAKLADTPPLEGLWSPGLQFTCIHFVPSTHKRLSVSPARTRVGAGNSGRRDWSLSSRLLVKRELPAGCEPWTRGRSRSWQGLQGLTFWVNLKTQRRSLPGCVMQGHERASPAEGTHLRRRRGEREQ